MNVESVENTDHCLQEKNMDNEVICKADIRYTLNPFFPIAIAISFISMFFGIMWY